ncbi:MAG: FIST C-terminal domain-containing protein [Gammaproteobacteria bacterium]|nr:FIST C-terminal domain-containing protein [Gammaproteobacteria bacterium]
MITKQITITSTNFDTNIVSELNDIQPQLILVFASIEFFTKPDFFIQLKENFPSAQIAGCSTAGEINSKHMVEHSAVITAIHFETEISFKIIDTPVERMEHSKQAGSEIGQALAGKNLQAILLFGKGIDINGSALIEGVTEHVGKQTLITGGLAGDNGSFNQTFVLSNSKILSDGIVAIGLSGNSLNISYGSYGGWSSFGPARKVTNSKDNILYELDGMPALQVYKKYLGEHAKDLPASGLLFPFEMLGKDHSALGLIRTILGVDEDTGALTLAGDINPDGYLRLMHASVDDLIDGAETAAQQLVFPETDTNGLAVLVSCVGRKLVMGDQVDEEIESVTEILGSKICVTGFYSYGEISPLSSITNCKLHNQTMTITYLSET